MREITGNLWDYYQKPNTIICITTNGTIKKNGRGVMGRGCAAEAVRRIPNIDLYLGDALRKFGNIPTRMGDLGQLIPLIFFPVKHNWYEAADLQLIKRSAQWLAIEAEVEPNTTFVLPRHGCGNGRLEWGRVKPLLETLPDNVWVITYA